MRGLRSYLVRDRLRHFAHARRGQLLDVLSYDIPGRDNATAVAVAHFLFGRTERGRGNGSARPYRYEGFVEKEGVVWLGQSVFLLTPQRSRELQDFLASRGVAFERVSVQVA